MLRWFNEVNGLVNWLLGYPNGTTETFAIWSVSLLALLIAMRCTCSIYGVANVAWLRMVLVLLIGIYSLLGAAALTKLYLLRYFKDPLIRQVAMFGIPIITYLLFGVPAQCEMLKATFVKTFLAFTSSVLVAILAINLTNSGFSSLGSGEQKTKNIRSRASNFQSMLDG